MFTHIVDYIAILCPLSSNAGLHLRFTMCFVETYFKGNKNHDIYGPYFMH